MEDTPQSPQFPIRIIFDDGGCEFIDTPDEIYTKLYSIDSTNPANRVWIRDDQDRSVRILMTQGELQILDVEKQG